MFRLHRDVLRCLSAFIVAALITSTPMVFAAGDEVDAAMAKIHPEALRADIRFLSDDLLEGRGTATRGYDIAARFMATQFEGLGLQPAGDAGTYYQRVPLRQLEIDQRASSVTFTRDGKSQSLIVAQDFLPFTDPARPDTSVEAPVVFAGYGVVAPDQHYDDYKGLDVKGKIVALLPGAPNFESALKAHYSSSEIKAKVAADHGAVGILGLDDPIQEKSYPFTKAARDLAFPEFRWLDKKGQPNDYFPELRAAAFVSLPITEKLFADQPHKSAEIFALAKEGKPLPTFALPITAKIHNVTKSHDTKGTNVVARLEGSDPQLKNEVVVYSAHLDHVGIGTAVNGDTIYNGALDNASGCATLLEIARALTTMNPRPRRSFLFVIVSGEEAGLLGSDYFATYPTVPARSIVADINIDEVLMLWPLRDIIAFGAEHSSLDTVIRKAADRFHLVESPDPMPEEVIFIRSDQYSFVKQGIPSVMASPGFKSEDPKINPAEIFGKWEEERYHQPQDDINQPGLDWEAATQFARYALYCGYLMAQDPQRPTWNKGDYFGDNYGHGTR
jgi:hypothetical protein